MSERRYDEEEVALILHRAVEAAATDQEGGAGVGLTLAELKEIAAEAGIDASRVETAATSLEVRRERALTPSSLGLPPTVQIERVVPAKLDADLLPQLLDLIRSEFARQGIVEEVLGGFEWRARSVMGGRYVSIRGEGDTTRVRVLGNYRDGLLTFAFGPGPIMAVLGGLLGGALSGANPLVIFPVGLLAWASALVPWRALFGRERKALRRVLDAIEQRLGEGS